MGNTKKETTEEKELQQQEPLQEETNKEKNTPEAKSETENKTVEKETLESETENSAIKAEAKETIETFKDSAKEKPKSKHQELLEKVEKSKNKAKEIFNSYAQIEEKLQETSKNLAKLENKILNSTVADSLNIMKELGADNLADEKAAVKEIALDNKEELLKVKDISKGRFKGFIVGLIAAAATAAGALGVGAKIADIPLNLNSLMQKANWDAIASKYASFISPANANPSIGYAAVGVASLLVGALAYKLITWLQGRKNEKYINSLENDLEGYQKNIEEKNSKLESLIEHINNIKLVMQKYDIILQEQNAKLKRIKFIEQVETPANLHKNSQAELEKTNLILDELLKLMNTKANNDVEIREKSLENLKSANALINEVIKKIYS